jgi:ABC-type nitrate/sulfonate/bicarbonate transport system permease component
MTNQPDVLRGVRGYISSNITTIKLFLMIISLPVFLLTWWGISSYLYTQNFFYLPTPQDVWEALVQSVTYDPATGVPLAESIYASLRRFLTGFIIAFALAVPLGLLLGKSQLIMAFSRPIVEVLRPVPPIAWVPFLFLAFGFFWGPVMAIFIGVFFPILENTIFGVRSVDPVLIDAAKTQGALNGKIFLKVILPSSVPYIMAGVKIGLGVGWMCIVAAEFFGAQGGGVGSMIVNGQAIARYDIMFAGMVTVAMLGLTTYLLSSYIEKKVLEWMGM